MKNLKQYVKRIAKIPKFTRKAEVVALIKSCVLDMWNDGYSSLKIARLMGKDHTTILHHLWGAGIEPQARIDANVRARKARQRAAAKLREKEKREKAAEVDKMVKAAVKYMRSGMTQAEAANLLHVGLNKLRYHMLATGAYKAKPHNSFSKRKLRVAVLESGKVSKMYDHAGKVSVSLGVSIPAVRSACNGHSPLLAKKYLVRYVDRDGNILKNFRD